MRRSVGTIDERDGRFRARIRIDGKILNIGTFVSLEEAESSIALFAEQHRSQAPFAGTSLRAWGRKWLDARELDGVHRSVTGERSIWRSRIDTAPFAELPIAAITTKDIREWVAQQLRTPVARKKGPAKTPARQTVVNALNLLRVALQSACEAEILDKNPARDIRVPRIARNTDPWTFLTADEITRLTGERVEQPYRDIFTFAIYSGLRAGEIFGLEWADVNLDSATVKIRHSWLRSPTKRGETRTLHLFGPALDALRRQKARTSKPRTCLLPSTASRTRAATTPS